MKNLLHKLLFPRWYVILAGVTASAALVPMVLGGVISIKAVEYISYAISAYSLTVLMIAIVRRHPVKRAKDLLRKNKYASKYLDELEVQGRVSLYLGVFVNAVYAVMKLVSGVIYGSAWFLTLGFYYLILGGIRLILSRDTFKTQGGRHTREWWVHSYKSYRKCGSLMFLLNVAVTSVAVYTIRENAYNVYPGFLIYANAAFSFYCVTISIINLVKFRRANNPILSASKAINLAGALVSIFALQTAMIPQFGKAGSSFQIIMNSITGGAVCVIIFGIALFMVIRSSIKIKQWRAADEGE